MHCLVLCKASARICCGNLWKWTWNMWKVFLDKYLKKNKRNSSYWMILWMMHQRALKLLKRLHVILMTIFPWSILHKIYSTKVNALLVLNLITWWFSRTLGTIHNLLLFARQNKVKFLMCTYKDTTSSPHSYLMLDWNQTLRKSFQYEATFWEIRKMYIYNILKEKKNYL